MYTENDKKNENKNYVTSSSSTTTTTPEGRTSSTTRACARAYEPFKRTSEMTNEEFDERFDMLCMEYRSCIGTVTPYIEDQLIYWFNTLSDVILTYAIHQTAMAPRPSWRYCLAIINRCMRQGVTPVQALADDTLTRIGDKSFYQKR